MAATELAQIHAAMSLAHAADPVPSLGKRRDRITRCIALLRASQDEICDALEDDYGSRAPIVTRLVEIGGAISALQYAHQELPGWMKRRKVRLEWSLWLGGARGWIDYLPKGVVGIVAPSNFPVQLTFAPLAAALAAGNRVMIKLPEATPQTSALVAELIRRHFAADEVQAVVGDAAIGAAFTRLPLDHLLFTGGPATGRKVMAAAAESLTPVTLELGGRSPVIVLEDADLRHAARSVLAGKLLNAGQVCLAPNHVYVPIRLRDAFVCALRDVADEMLITPCPPTRLNGFLSTDQLARQRMMIDDARLKGAAVIELAPDHGLSQIGPTLVVGATPGMAVLESEIFGPVLPIISYGDVAGILEIIGRGERPLALYVFGRSKRMIERILCGTVSGGVTVNDILLHASSERLPLGGIGESGMGAYRGRWGFDAFSHARPVVRRGWADAGRVLRPPYGWLADVAARFLVGRA